MHDVAWAIVTKRGERGEGDGSGMVENAMLRIYERNVSCLGAPPPYARTLSKDSRPTLPPRIELVTFLANVSRFLLRSSAASIEQEHNLSCYMNEPFRIQSLTFVKRIVRVSVTRTTFTVSFIVESHRSLHNSRLQEEILHADQHGVQAQNLYTSNYK